MHRLFVPLTVAAAGVISSIGAGLLVHREQLDDAMAVFARLTYARAEVVEQQVGWHIQTLRALKGLYAASQRVDDPEFVTFVETWLPPEARQGALLALGWIPVDGAEPVVIYSNVPSVAAPGASAHEDGEALGDLRGPDAAHELIVRAGVPWRGLPHEETGRVVTLLAPLYRADASGAAQPRGHLFAVLDLTRLLHAAPSAGAISERAFLASGEGTMVIETRWPELAALPDRSLTTSSALQFPGFAIGLEFIGDPDVYLPPLWSDPTALMTLASGLIVSLFLAAYVNASILRNRALREARRAAERANVLKSEFLATMSHEIRTPMHAILGMTELLMDSALDARQMSYARTAFTSAEQLLRIIDDILDFSKIESGRLELDPVATDLVEIVDELGELFAVQAREKAVEFITRYVPGSERFVIADALRVRQIISNLVANAIKFTERGHIILAVEQLHDAPVEQGQVRLRISIEDTGIGIPAEAQTHLFERFQQVDGSITRKYGGTGLGLAICRQLVEMMAGEIRVQSAPGRGSTFWFTLTLPSNQEHYLAPPSAAILKDVKILIVDDVPINLTLVAEQLALHGMRCAGAPDGDEALRQLHAAAAAGDPFQIVIIDYLMPGRNGEQLARTIKADPRLKDAALVMFTAAGGKDLLEMCAGQGFSGYVPKPVRVNQLIETLAAVCRSCRNGTAGDLVRADALAAGAPAATTGWRCDGARVLLAEDNRVNQAFTVDVLQRLGCSVTVAGNGQEALEATREERFDVIFMDCQMPVMDGFEATRRIRALMTRGEVPTAPIIALTANAMRGDRERCLSAGMCAYLPKPVRRGDLEGALRKWLQPGRAGEEVAAPDTTSAPVAGSGPDPQGSPSAASTDPDAARAQAPGGPPAGAEPEVLAAPQAEAPRAGGTHEALLDPEEVAKARAAMQDRFSTMIEYFVEDVTAHLTTIEHGLEVGDPGAVVRPAHNIKSAARQLGARKLASLAGELEAAARTALDQDSSSIDPVKRTTLLALLRSTFEESTAALKHIDRKPPAHAA